MLKSLRARFALALLPKEVKNNITQVASGSPFQSLFSGTTSPRLGTKELLEAYSEMPWLRAVSNKIGQAVGTTHWKLFIGRSSSKKAIRRTKMQRANYALRKGLVLKELEKGDLEEIEDHPLLDLLTLGNPALNGESIFQTTQTHMDLVGEAFWIFERNVSGMPINIWPVSPEWITSLPTTSDPFYKLRLGTRHVDVPPTEVIFFKDPDPANPYERGVGVAKSLGDELEIDEYAAKHLKNFFYNRARPDVIIHGDGLQRTDTARMQEDWLTKHQGFWNAWKPHFVNRKIEVTELGASLENMQMVDIRKAERDAVLQVFGAPPEKFGVLTASNRSTITSADFFWTKDIVLPRVEKLRNQLQQQLIPLFDDKLILDFESPIVEDAEHILAVMNGNPGAFTKNEWRETAERESLGETGEVFMIRSGELERPLSAGPMTELPTPPAPPASASPKSISKEDLETRIRKRLGERLSEVKAPELQKTEK